MKLGTLKPGYIAGQNVRLDWKKKLASFKKISFFSFFLLPPLFLLFIEVKHFSAWNLTQEEHPFSRSSRPEWWGEGRKPKQTQKQKKPKHTHTNSLSTSPASSASAGAQVLLYFKPRVRCLSWRKPPRCEMCPSNGHMICPGHSRLQLTTCSQKNQNPPVSSMKTFIESVHFLEIIYFMVKNNIPKKLDCVPCSQWIPRKSEAFEWKTKKCNHFYCSCA